ncbi:MAG: hypothetical protein K6G04_06340 [Lachnospiraceae bacterium]|nr:hypothetical protein [Lachnospiraceae bacterium]
MKRIKEALTNNIGLKLMALAFSIALWIIVVNVDDPNQSKNFTATVQVTNAEVLANQGRYYSIDGENTVTFRVTAKRSVIERLSSSDFVATADMNQLENDSQIPIEISATRYSGSISIAPRTRYLNVEVGELMSAKFVISGKTTGEPATGSAVAKVSVTPNVVSVKGPDEIVSTIDRVIATCDVGGMNADITENVVPVFYDSDGNVVDTTKLELSVSTVEVSVNMTSTKSVAIDITSADGLPSGMQIDGVTIDPGSVDIKGEASVLNGITKISIPSNVFDLANETEGITTTVDISQYLPEGVTLLDGEQSQVNVTIKLAAAVTKTFSVPTSNITINGLGDGLNAKIEESSVSVIISGTESSLSELSQNLITGYVDATGLKAGTHSLVITFNLDEQYHSSTEMVTLNLEKPGAAAENSAGEGGTNTTETKKDDKNTESENSNNSHTEE